MAQFFYFMYLNGYKVYIENVTTLFRNNKIVLSYYWENIYLYILYSTYPPEIQRNITVKRGYRNNTFPFSSSIIEGIEYLYKFLVAWHYSFLITYNIK